MEASQKGEKEKMKLMTKEVEHRLERSPIYSKEKQLLDAQVAVKFFNPTGAGTWLITEGEKQEDGDWLLYGYITLGFGWEWGYVLLSELQSFRGLFGLGIERDLYAPKDATVNDLL